MIRAGETERKCSQHKKGSSRKGPITPLPSEAERPSPSWELPTRYAATSKLDRIIITAREVPLQELGRIPDYRAKKPKRLWKKLYREVTRIYGTGSIRKIFIESGPNVGWLPKFRITFIPRD